MHLEWKNHQNLRDKEANIEAEVTLLEKRSGKLLARGQIYRSQNVKDACQPVIAQKALLHFSNMRTIAKMVSTHIKPTQQDTTSNSTRANQIRSFLLPSLGPVGPVGPVPNRSETSEQTISSAPRGSSQTCTLPDRRPQVIDCSWMISGCRICRVCIDKQAKGNIRRLWANDFRRILCKGCLSTTSAHNCSNLAS